MFSLGSCCYCNSRYSLYKGCESLNLFFIKLIELVYAVIKNVIAPLLGDPKRIAIAINQCDMAKKGHDWNKEQGIPEPALVDFLDKQAASVQTRIAESTGLWTKPVYYSALYHYNISKLLLTMLTNLPEGKRFLFTDSMNREPSIWAKNDSEQDYNQEIQSVSSFCASSAASRRTSGEASMSNT